jgi:tetratricopeptide (TPR) repeat protein
VLVAAILMPALAAVAATEGPSSTRPQEDYLRALAACARGELEPAVEAVVDLETRTGSGGRSAGALRGAQRGVARRIARRSPEALLPVALLHQRVFLAHAGAGRHGLASAAGQQAEVVAQSYARAGGERVLAAALLTSLAGHWHARFQESAAELLYRQALELDPEHAAALLGLAVVSEKRGYLREAEALLEAVARQAPGDRETSLRSALVQARLGRSEPALEALEALVSQGGEDWIVSLAYQERARLLASNGRLAEAFGVAREGEANLPCDPALSVLAAFYGERSGVVVDGLVQSLAACAQESPQSARRIYNQQPRRLLELSRLRLEEAERERLPGLAAALDGRGRR